MMNPVLILAFLVSGQGTTMNAVIEACERGEINARVGVVISNNSRCGARQIAENKGILFYHVSSFTNPDESDHNERIIILLRQHSVNLVILAGYLKKVRSPILQEFTTLNIHPSLLPKYGGENMYGRRVHEEVLKNKEIFTGVTVHHVNDEYDMGDIIAQSQVRVFDSDSVETLESRVKLAGNALLVNVLKNYCNAHTFCSDVIQINDCGKRRRCE